MIVNLYTFYDTKAEVYLPPLCAFNDRSALRDVYNALRDSRTPMGQHPSDFIFYYIGKYDDSTGLVSADAPRQLGNGLQIIDGFRPVQSVQPSVSEEA